METMHFSIEICAPREKVWDTMLGEETYKEWTKAFEPGSHYAGDWSEGSDIRFLSADSSMGMASRIKENRYPEFLSIEHLGLVQGGVVDTTSDEAQKWASALENYSFTEVDGGTNVSVSLSVLPEYKPMFEQSWPEALKLLKELVEG